MKLSATIGAAALAGLAISACPAMAGSYPATNLCSKDATFGGGGAFNFTCKNDPQNYCIPYAALNVDLPRGDASAIDAWVRGVQVNATFSFVDQGDVSSAICAIPHSHRANGVGTE